MFDTELLPPSVWGLTYSSLQLTEAEWKLLGYNQYPFSDFNKPVHRTGMKTRSFTDQTDSSYLLPKAWDMYVEDLNARVAKRKLQHRRLQPTQKQVDCALASGYFVIFYSDYLQATGDKMFELLFKTEGLL